MALNMIWEKEKSKRVSFADERLRCDRNWVFHKERVLRVFEEFTDMAERYISLDYEVAVRARGDDYPIRRGQDSVVLSECQRLTSRRTIYNNGTSVQIDREKESGGSLTIYYTYEQALIQIFLIPPKLDKSVIEKTDVLLWVGRNTDSITVRFCEQLIAKYLMFCRVESNFERSSFIERLQVRWWRFMDARNRRQIYDTHVNLLNRWEVPVAAATLAIISIVISLAKL